MVSSSRRVSSRAWIDDDGGLTGDSLWHYTWDAENRLNEMAMKTGTGLSGTTRKRMLFDQADVVKSR
jgi:hypothetical protein